MSDAYLKKFGKKRCSKKQMREHCQRPGTTDEAGNLVYTTEQHHKNECDVNQIIRKYDKTGLITHITRFEAKFGDLSGHDFKTMQDQVAAAAVMFQALPSEIRNKFDNNPADLLTFMDNPNNRKAAIEMGLIRAEWPESQDGLGEHVTQEQADLRDGTESGEAGSSE